MDSCQQKFLFSSHSHLKRLKRTLWIFAPHNSWRFEVCWMASSIFSFLKFKKECPMERATQFHKGFLLQLHLSLIKVMLKKFHGLGLAYLLPGWSSNLNIESSSKTLRVSWFQDIQLWVVEEGQRLGWLAGQFSASHYYRSMHEWRTGSW